MVNTSLWAPIHLYIQDKDNSYQKLPSHFNSYKYVEACFKINYGILWNVMALWMLE